LKVSPVISSLPEATVAAVLPLIRNSESNTPPSRLENLLRRDRRIIIACLICVSAVCWWWIFAGAGMGMSALEMTHPALYEQQGSMDMNMVMPKAWSPAYAVLMFFMWWIMMIAMMLPSASPVILLAAAINRRSAVDRKPYGSVGLFVLGYLSAWAAFSLAAVLAQWLLEKAGMLSMLMQSANHLLSAVLLIIAGMWQFSQYKQACLKHCRSPVEFLSNHRREGAWGAVMMGAHHGVYCLGCCWFLMALLFVGGVMNLYWIIGLALFVYFEKVLGYGERLGKVAGVALMVAGAVLLWVYS
jgi:predicted metal-binding membrane protein